MIDLAALPEIDVQPAEYERLLGYPRGAELSPRARDLCAWAREWYRENGRPFVFAREAEALRIEAEATIRIDGVALLSARLHRTLQQAGAHGAILFAVSAGPEVERESQKLWREDKPDEYFFLEIYGSAVVERLVVLTGARLCAWADPCGIAVLPHYSPGYPEWDVREQQRLLDVIHPAASPIEVLESGMLRPKKSLLGVFGLTREIARVRGVLQLIPCETCSFHPCQFRRAPYRHDATFAPPCAPQPNYAVNRRALERWARERLTLNRRDDGSIDARFRFDGTTCTNLGRPLAFDYHVSLGPRESGYLIRDGRCVPTPGDLGYTSMCRYLDSPAELMAAIDRERPLIGSPLSDALTWKRAVCQTGCYCEPAGREHKWGLVLETIHFALNRTS